MRALGVVIAMAIVGCGTTGQRAVVIPVHGRGVESLPFEVGAWTVTLERAEVAVGPLWMCATVGASADLCPTALFELRTAARIDGLDPTVQMLAEANAITGTVRSATYDLGIVWLAPAPGPMALEGAPDGHSAVFRGSATDGARTIRFAADVDLTPGMAGQTIVSGARTEHEIVEAADALVLAVDPIAWWRRIDFDELATHAGDPIVVERGDPAYESLIIAITTGERIGIEWGAP